MTTPTPRRPPRHDLPVMKRLEPTRRIFRDRLGGGFVICDLRAKYHPELPVLLAGPYLTADDSRAALPEYLRSAADVVRLRVTHTEVRLLMDPATARDLLIERTWQPDYPGLHRCLPDLRRPALVTDVAVDDLILTAEIAQ